MRGPRPNKRPLAARRGGRGAYGRFSLAAAGGFACRRRSGRAGGFTSRGWVTHAVVVTYSG